MKNRVVPFVGRYPKGPKFLPLTTKMIDTLSAALKLQNSGIPFGPTSVKGSFTTLIGRELIKLKMVRLDGHTKYEWEVTKEAIVKLKELGF